MTTKHIPTPWKLYTGKLRAQFPMAVVIEIQAKGRYPIISWPGFDESAVPKSQHLANAAFIVRACNAYEDIKKALRDALEASHDPKVERILQAALALTKEAPHA